MPIPLTRPVTIMLHEPVFRLIKDVADDETNSNISDYIRSIVYADLLKRRVLTIEQAAELS